MTGDTGCTEQRTEQVFFLTVEIHLKRLDIRQCTKTRFSVLGLEVIVILRDVSDGIYRPSVIWFVTDISLVIKKIWFILSSRFEGS